MVLLEYLLGYVLIFFKIIYAHYAYLYGKSSKEDLTFKESFKNLQFFSDL